jgi:hypothetical protein
MIKFNRATPSFILLVTAAETNIDLNDFMVLLKQNYIVLLMSVSIRWLAITGAHLQLTIATKLHTQGVKAMLE